MKNVKNDILNICGTIIDDKAAYCAVLYTMRRYTMTLVSAYLVMVLEENDDKS